jgi:hypothetical protein
MLTVLMHRRRVGGGRQADLVIGLAIASALGLAGGVLLLLAW